jgi:hypothetical protein
MGTDGVQIRQSLGISAVQSYVTAIVDQSLQRSKGMNPLPESPWRSV